MRSREIQEVLSIRQEVRPAMRIVLHSIHFGHRDRRSAFGGHNVQWHIDLRAKENNAARTPRAAASVLRIAQAERRPTGRVNTLELLVGKKTYRAAVWRPKGITRALSPIQRLRLERIQRSDPQARRSGLVHRHKGHALAIR